MLTELSKRCGGILSSRVRELFPETEEEVFECERFFHSFPGFLARRSNITLPSTCRTSASICRKCYAIHTSYHSMWEPASGRSTDRQVSIINALLSTSSHLHCQGCFFFVRRGVPTLCLTLDDEREETGFNTRVCREREWGGMNTRTREHPTKGPRNLGTHWLEPDI